MSGEHEYRVADEPGHGEPVEQRQALAEWAAAHPRTEAQEDSEAGS
jgi:hypothetical protein